MSIIVKQNSGDTGTTLQNFVYQGVTLKKVVVKTTPSDTGVVVYEASPAPTATKYFIATFPLETSKAEFDTFFTELDTNLAETTGNKIILCPPDIYTSYCDSKAKASTKLKDITEMGGGSMCYAATSGAYTGQLSALQLKDTNNNYLLCGQKAQRSALGYTYENVAAQIQLALANNITPIVFITEDDEEMLKQLYPDNTPTSEEGFNNEDVAAVLNARITDLVNRLGAEAVSSCIIAYEPGKDANTYNIIKTPDQVYDIIAQLPRTYKYVFNGRTSSGKTQSDYARLSDLLGIVGYASSMSTGTGLATIINNV